MRLARCLTLLAATRSREPRLRIAFCEELAPKKNGGIEVGTVSVAFTGKVEFDPSGHDREARLRALWARYRKRHPELGLPLARYAKLRGFCAERLAKQAAPAARSSVSAAPAGARAWVRASRQLKSFERAR